MAFFTRQAVPRVNSGLYTFDIHEHGSKSRVHLRIDEDGSGLLVVNASRVVHLNPTAMQMAYYHLNKIEQKAALKSLSSVFNVPSKRLA